MKCFVDNCFTYADQKKPGISFFRFPTCENLRKLWIKACASGIPRKHDVICSLHFHLNEIVVGKQRKTVRVKTIPSVFGEYKEIKMKRQLDEDQEAEMKKQLAEAEGQKGKMKRQLAKDQKAENKPAKDLELYPVALLKNIALQNSNNLVPEPLICEPVNILPNVDDSSRVSASPEVEIIGNNDVTMVEGENTIISPSTPSSASPKINAAPEFRHFRQIQIPNICSIGDNYSTTDSCPETQQSPLSPTVSEFRTYSKLTPTATSITESDMTMAISKKDMFEVKSSSRVGHSPEFENYPRIILPRIRIPLKAKEKFEKSQRIAAEAIENTAPKIETWATKSKRIRKPKKFFPENINTLHVNTASKTHSVAPAKMYPKNKIMATKVKREQKPKKSISEATTCPQVNTPHKDESIPRIRIVPKTKMLPRDFKKVQKLKEVIMKTTMSPQANTLSTTSISPKICNIAKDIKIAGEQNNPLREVKASPPVKIVSKIDGITQTNKFPKIRIIAKNGLKGQQIILPKIDMSSKIQIVDEVTGKVQNYKVALPKGKVLPRPVNIFPTKTNINDPPYIKIDDESDGQMENYKIVLPKGKVQPPPVNISSPKTSISDPPSIEINDESDGQMENYKIVLPKGKVQPPPVNISSPKTTISDPPSIEIDDESDGQMENYKIVLPKGKVQPPPVNISSPKTSISDPPSIEIDDESDVDVEECGPQLIIPEPMLPETNNAPKTSISYVGGVPLELTALLNINIPPKPDVKDNNLQIHILPSINISPIPNESPEYPINVKSAIDTITDILCIQKQELNLLREAMRKKTLRIKSLRSIVRRNERCYKLKAIKKCFRKRDRKKPIVSNTNLCINCNNINNNNSNNSINNKY